MSQNVVNYGIDPSGAQLLDELLSGEQQNRLTMDGGNSRPSYAEIGTVWTDKSVEGKATLKRFNGTSDNALMTIDETTGAITIPGIADTDLSNLSTTGKHYVAFKGYDVAETYSINDIVVNVDADNEVKIYQSLADDNTSALTDGTKWKEVSLGGGGGGGGGEIGDMGFAPLGIDESLNLRRYLNGQVISQTQFVSFTAKVKSAVALFPSLATTEVNWQAEKALSKFGQVGKFVIDDENQTIRLPAVVNAQGLLSLSGIGNLVNESLPNITGQTPQLATHMNQASLNLLSGAFTISDDKPVTRGWSGADSDEFKSYEFNANKVSSTYQDNAPVQQEPVQYPYYIQVATGIEETLPAIREYKVNNSDFFGKSMYSDIAPDNASWLASNGQYNARIVYPDYYDWLVEQMNAGVSGFVASTATYTDYDFVINTENQTFRLPLKNGQEGVFADGVKGNGMTLGLTNGTYEKGLSYNNSSSSWYGLTPSGQQNKAVGTNVSTQLEGLGTAYGITTDPSKSGMVVDKTVPEGWNLYYYVGDTVQDASLINAGAVLGQLSDKISRTATSDKELVVGWGMPDYSAGVSKALNTSITATRNCFVAVLSANGTNTAGLYVNDAKIGAGGNLYASSYVCLTAYVEKGQTYRTENIATYGSWVGSVTEYPLIGG